MSAFLDVEHSLTGRRWEGPGVELARRAEALEQEAGLAPALAAVLARRGVGAAEAEGFLAPTLRELLPDPRGLKDMEVAAARLLDAVGRREAIAIFADYDVDGGASAALLIDWLRGFGQRATLYVPDRIEEGYGPNTPAMEQLAEGHKLIVCVDCGTLSHAPIAAAVAKGADVLVLDHHLGGETLPPALAVVNPNRQDEAGAPGYLCAAGVVFLLLVEAGRRLRESGRKGLKVMAQRRRPGLTALSDVARVNTTPTAYHLGFVLGPRINAGGRIGESDLGARLLATEDPHEARALAERLDALNKERREVEAGVLAGAMAQAEARGLEAPLAWAAADGWHPGVVGIVASRMKEAANRPSVVIGFDGDEGKGSGRSVTGVDLGAAVHKLEAEGLITRGGGHVMAAGLSLTRAQLEPAMERLAALLARQGAGAQGPRVLHVDAMLMPAGVTPELIDSIEAAGPFGASAPAPRFALPDCRIDYAREVGQSHLKLTLSDGLGHRLDAIAFGAFDTPLGGALVNHGGARFHLAGRLELNHWNGRVTPQLRLDDAAPAG